MTRVMRGLADRGVDRVHVGVSPWRRCGAASTDAEVPVAPCRLDRARCRGRREVSSTCRLAEQREQRIGHAGLPAAILIRRDISRESIVPDFYALYTTNAGPYTATIQVELNESHQTGSFEYMDKVRRAIASDYPQLRTFFSSGSKRYPVFNSRIT